MFREKEQLLVERSAEDVSSMSVRPHFAFQSSLFDWKSSVFWWMQNQELARHQVAGTQDLLSGNEVS